MHKGSILNTYVIDRLGAYGVRYVLIRKSRFVKEPIKESPYSSKAQEEIVHLRRPDPPKIYIEKHIRERISKGVELMYKDPRQEVIVNASNLIADDLLHSIERNNAVALNIMELKVTDEYTFRHSVDVAAIAMIIAKRENRPENTIRELGIAGLLLDIGKIKVPQEILNKPSKLTPEEYEIMKKHSLYSYEMIKDNPSLSKSIKLGVLEHHEKLDGSGYPYGLKDKDICPYARILAIADIYDALCATRPYKVGLTQRQAVELLLGMIGQLDTDDLNAFLASTVLYPVDSVVKLSNGEEAKVVRNNPSLMMRPVVVGIKSGKVYDLSSLDCMNDSPFKS